MVRRFAGNRRRSGGHPGWFRQGWRKSVHPRRPCRQRRQALGQFAASDLDPRSGQPGGRGSLRARRQSANFDQRWGVVFLALGVRRFDRLCGSFDVSPRAGLDRR